MFKEAKNNIGNYIRFAGQNGLQREKVKIGFYRILGVNNHLQIFLKEYRHKGFTILQPYCQGQEFEIINKDEFINKRIIIIFI